MAPATTQQRVAIWAAVSSRPQAERDSIPDQLAAGREFVARRNGLLVAELVVPGESRSYPTIAEAIAGMDAPCAYADLLALLARRSIDVLWCRSLDRLGRTDPLIAEVQWRCQQIGAVVWSEQMPPTGQPAGDLYLSAIERAGAQRELIEFQRRSQYGKNARARHGRMMASARVPFGYTAAYDGRVRVAVVNPDEAAAFRWGVEALLSRSHTDAQIHARWRELFPYRKFHKGAAREILGNPFHAGLVVRNTTGPDGQPLRIEAPGLHEPLIDLDTHRQIVRYLAMRAEGRRPPAKTLWAGLLWCDYCGGRMHSHTVQLVTMTQVYYYCWTRIDKRPCPATTINECTIGDVTRAMAVYLRQQYERDANDLAAITASLAPDPLPALERQLEALTQRRDRLTMLFSLGRIDLAEFDAQRAAIQRELLATQAEITAARNSADQAQRHNDTLAMLRDVLPDLEHRLSAIDPIAGNRWLREIFAEIRIRDKRVVAVRIA